MNELDWAMFGIGYLSKARQAAHEDFNLAMKELKDNARFRDESWYATCKNTLPHLYHYSLEFTGDGRIPGDKFGSPLNFSHQLDEYKAFVTEMAQELDNQAQIYEHKGKPAAIPQLHYLVRNRVAYILYAIDYVQSVKTPSVSGITSASNPLFTFSADLAVVQGLAARFHESVLSLKSHPHGGDIFSVQDEWDCQYLFRAILAAYFRDVRLEEWNPSVAGSSSRCEFFLKPLQTMVELKYVRNASDQKKIKSQLLTDFADYGANAGVSFLIVLIYDPLHRLDAPFALQEDLSGPTKGLTDIRVVVSPPR